MVFMRTFFGRRFPRDEQGVVAVLTALLMVGLALCAAIVVDLGNARDVRRQSQNAADASSLAGANVLYPSTDVCSSGVEPCITDAVAAAKSYALTNFQVSASDWSTCTAPAGSALAYVPGGGTSCISFDSATSPTLVRVYLPTRTVPTFFGRIAGVSSIPVGSSAQAQLGVAVTCSLCFLGDVNAGNGDFSVFGGDIAVDGNVTVGPTSIWTSQSNGIHGTVTGNPSDFLPAAISIPAFGDPLATSLTLPFNEAGLLPKTDPCSATATGGPGLYGAFSLPDSACTLQPGLYVISGTWDMKNNTVLNGAGVTLYVTSPSGYLDFKNGIVNIIAPSGGVSAGYAIVYDRINSNPLGLQGNGVTSITGVVYAPDSILAFNGNSCFGFSGGPIILNGASTNGNQSCVTISNAVSDTVHRALLHLNQ
jgi:hypothetical protein